MLRLVSGLNALTFKLSAEELGILWLKYAEIFIQVEMVLYVIIRNVFILALKFS